MTKREGKVEAIDSKGLLARNEDFVRVDWSGYYNRSLIRRVGTLEQLCRILKTQGTGAPHAIAQVSQADL